MKNILLILAAVGLTACSKGVVKNTVEGVSISVAGNEVESGGCWEWTVFLGIFGDSSVEIKTWGDNSTKIGKEENYEVGYYVVNNVSQEDGAVTKQDEAPQCTTPPAEKDPAVAAVVAARKVAVEAADAAVTAAEAASKKAESMTPSGPPIAITQTEVDEAKAAAGALKEDAAAVKKEAEDADTEEKANDAKKKADAIKTKADAL